jgi:hypothetical protein
MRHNVIVTDRHTPMHARTRYCVSTALKRQRRRLPTATSAHALFAIRQQFRYRSSEAVRVATHVRIFRREGSPCNGINFRISRRADPLRRNTNDSGLGDDMETSPLHSGGWLHWTRTSDRRPPAPYPLPRSSIFQLAASPPISRRSHRRKLVVWSAASAIVIPSSLHASVVTREPR